MWSETCLKNAMHADPDSMFGQRVQIIDLDWKNTPAGRVDAVLVNGDMQLVVVEFERSLTPRIIEHALIDQAWAYAEHCYMSCDRDSVVSLYENYYRHYYPSKAVPALQRRLALPVGQAVDWKRRKVIVIAAAWRVDDCVPEMAAGLCQDKASQSSVPLPFECWVYELSGRETGPGAIKITDCQRHLVYKQRGADRSKAPVGVRTEASSQHKLAGLTELYSAVQALLPKHLPPNLASRLTLRSKANWRKQIAKFLPWGHLCGVCFEMSTKDDKNNIKGPHFQLYVPQNKELGEFLRDHLRPKWPEIARKLHCKPSDFASQQRSYPIKQHNVDWSSPEAIAKGFGGFAAVIHGYVDPFVKKVAG